MFGRSVRCVVVVLFWVNFRALVMVMTCALKWHPLKNYMSLHSWDFLNKVLFSCLGV